jgi:hypothetical protein
LIFSSPIVVLIFILEIMISDIWVAIANTDIDPFVFQDSRDFS